MWQTVGQPGTLSDRIVAQVEGLIASAELSADDVLPPEREMARLLGVSRTSLREAIRILVDRGRIVVRHGQGIYVRAEQTERELRAAAAHTEVTLNELFAMREILEVPAADWAAKQVDEPQLHEIRAALDALNDAIDSGVAEQDQLAKLDAEFHLAIVAAAGNRFLRQVSNVLHELIMSGMETTLLIPGRLDISRSEHERIYDALAEHRPAAARKAVRLHVRGAHRAAVRLVGSEPAAPRTD